MRFLLLIVALPFFVFSQNSFEKELFPNVSQLEKVSPSETKFLDNNGKVLGIRRVSSKDTLYLDKMHRKLQSLPVKVVEQLNSNAANPTTPSTIANDTETEVVIGSVKDGKQPYIVRRRNRVIYYNGDGTKDMVVRQRRNGKKLSK